MEQASFCTNCGFPVTPLSQFCNACGNRVATQPLRVEPAKISKLNTLVGKTASPHGSLTSPIARAILLIGLLFSGFMAISHISDRPPDLESHIANPSPISAVPTEPDERLVKKLTDAKKRLAALKPRFLNMKDEFTGITTIRHRAFSKYMNGNGTTLEIEIHQRGHSPSLFLESEYVSDDWLFHDVFTIKTKSTQLAAEGPTQREVITGAGICETVSADSDTSYAMASAIAEAGTQPVRVRLDGKFRHDYTLRAAHQKAIAETFEYFQLLKIVNPD